MERTAFIVNPAAGRGRSKKIWEQLKVYLDTNGVEYREFVTGTEGEEQLLSEQARRQGYTTLVSVGGDGTLHGIINGLTTLSGITIGIIPTGTGNDLRRSLGIGADPLEALKGVMTWKPQPMDLGRAGNLIFANITGTGFDARVADKVNKGMRFFSGTSAYVAAVFHQLIYLKCPRMTITWDTGQWDRDTLLVAVGNGRCYGGGLYMTPGAVADDSLFDVCLIKKVSRLQVAVLLPKLFSGSHISHPAVTIMRTSRLTIEGSEEILINTDGEVLPVKAPVEMEIIPAAVKVLRPETVA